MGLRESGGRDKRKLSIRYVCCAQMQLYGEWLLTVTGALRWNKGMNIIGLLAVTYFVILPWISREKWKCTQSHLTDVSSVEEIQRPSIYPGKIAILVMIGKYSGKKSQLQYTTLKDKLNYTYTQKKEIHNASRVSLSAQGSNHLYYLAQGDGALGYI